MSEDEREPQVAEVKVTDEGLFPEAPESDRQKIVRGRRKATRTTLSRATVLPGGVIVQDPLKLASKPRPLKKVELVKRLGAQYAERRETLKHFGFLGKNGKTKEGDAKIPSFKEAMGTITAEELEIARGFQKPTLILMPETSLGVKIQAIDENLPNNGRIMSGSKAVTYVNGLFKLDDGPSVVTGWRALIADGNPEMGTYDDGDDENATFESRINHLMSRLKPGVKIVDPQIQAMLIMEAIKNGEPIDQNTYTLFPGYNPDLDPKLVAPRIFLSRWDAYYKRPEFSWDAPTHIDPRAMIRHYVGGRLIVSV